jgi:hypothetical protein
MAFHENSNKREDKSYPDTFIGTYKSISTIIKTFQPHRGPYQPEDVTVTG